MSTQMKSIMLLLATLVIGVAAGASITGALVRERLEYVRSFGNAEGFAVRFTEFIEPLRDDQKAEIEPLLEAAGADIQNVFGGAGREIYAIIEQLEDDLSSHLTEEQIARLRMRRAEIRNRYIGRYTIATEKELRPGK